jgi:DNA (cytosine-5)-methyltransferase 1
MPSNPHAWHLADLDKVEKSGLRTFSTFACGGGSSMGYKLAGYTMVGANDIDPEMRWHYETNLHPPRFIQGPIRDLITSNLPDELYDLDVLDGSPPCSTFSMAGSREAAWGREKHFREGQAVQVLDDLFFDYLDLVNRLRPRVAVAENVKGMLLGNARGYVQAISARFKAMGYRPQLFLVNAADCGVPQRRERVFFVAAREDLKIEPLQLNPAKKWVTVGEACHDLQNLTPDEIKHTKPSNLDRRYWHLTSKGRTYELAATELDKKKAYWNTRRLDDTMPSFTITATDSMRHWNECRLLTFRETKRLGSFPDDYVAKSENIGKYMVGMSVPPRMMETVAAAIRDQWLTNG